jgi:SlyX protein
MADLGKIEERIAHLERMLDDLSEVVARQDGEIARLTRRVEMLMSREAEREVEAGGTAPLADQKPPHW